MRIPPHAMGRAAAAVIFTTILTTGCSTTQWGTARSMRAGTHYSLLPASPEHGPNASFVPDDVLFNPGSLASLYSHSELHFEHPKVDAFVLAYETRSRGTFERALGRSARYVPRMAAILREEGVPAELAYLPLIESGFNTRAVSPAGAAGPWQFIPETGRRYGLRIDSYVDERRDPDKSTRAAAQYLRDLYNMFGNWHLSLAAYNTGEYRVARTMDREGTDSYWDLMENRDLHPETCDYVPRFLAALTIAQAPEAHGFESPPPAPIRSDLVEVDRSVSLRTLAELVGASETELKDLNPALLRGVTPPDSSGYKIRVPEGTKGQFELAYARVLREARDAQADPELVAEPDAGYRVRRGDSVAGIAKRFGVSPQALLRANGLRSPKQLQVGASLRLPGSGARVSTVASAPKGNSGRSKIAAAVSPKRSQTAKAGGTKVAKRQAGGAASISKASAVKTAKAPRATAKVAAGAKPSAAKSATAKKAKPEVVRVARGR